MTRIYPRFPGLGPNAKQRTDALLADPERARVADLMLSASTLEEVEAAWVAQHAWLVANPDDFGVLEAGEYLANVEEGLRGEDVYGKLPAAAAPASQDAA